jgi:predicted O-methyltransferase YrrM
MVFEIGTFDGRTTLNISRNAPDDARIYTLDLPPTEQQLPPGTSVGAKLVAQPKDRLIQLLGDSRAMDFRAYQGQFDLVFVDAAHDYDSVANDSRIALELLRPEAKGIIIWHDYVRFSGVTRAVDELLEQVVAPSHFCHIEGTTLAFLQTSGHQPPRRAVR